MDCFRILVHVRRAYLRITTLSGRIMTEQHESNAATRFNVAARFSRPATWMAASVVLLTAICGLWVPDAKAQGAAADQAAPVLTNETCLGCHGQEGFAPAHKPEPGSTPPILTDRCGIGRSGSPDTPPAADLYILGCRQRGKCNCYLRGGGVIFLVASEA